MQINQGTRISNRVLQLLLDALISWLDLEVLLALLVIAQFILLNQLLHIAS